VRADLDPGSTERLEVKRIATLLLLLSCGCAVREPIRVMYCEQKTPDGKHCAVWAKKTHPPCVHDAAGDCTPNTR